MRRWIITPSTVLFGDFSSRPHTALKEFLVPNWDSFSEQCQNGTRLDLPSATSQRMGQQSGQIRMSSKTLRDTEAQWAIAMRRMDRWRRLRAIRRRSRQMLPAGLGAGRQSCAQRSARGERGWERGAGRTCLEWQVGGGIRFLEYIPRKEWPSRARRWCWRICESAPWTWRGPTRRTERPSRIATDSAG
jgi:hypothetical protein